MQGLVRVPMMVATTIGEKAGRVTTKPEMAKASEVRATPVVPSEAELVAGLEGVDKKRLVRALQVAAARRLELCSCNECCSEKHAELLWTGSATQEMALHFPGEVPCGDCSGRACWEGADCESCAGFGYVRCGSW